MRYLRRKTDGEIFGYNPILAEQSGYEVLDIPEPPMGDPMVDSVFLGDEIIIKRKK